MRGKKVDGVEQYDAVCVHRGGSNVFECTMCDVMVTSEDQLNTHLRGIKHQNKMKQASGENLNRRGRGRGLGALRGGRGGEPGGRGERDMFVVSVSNVLYLCA